MLWNYPHSQCAYFDAEQDIALLFKQIQERVVNRKFMLNTDNIIWAQEHLNRSKILSNFVMKINALGKS